MGEVAIGNPLGIYLPYLDHAQQTAQPRGSCIVALFLLKILYWPSPYQLFNLLLYSVTEETSLSKVPVGTKLLAPAGFHRITQLEVAFIS